MRRSKRSAALDRNELREGTAPRTFVGITSMAVKTTDAATRALIDEWLERRSREE